MMFKRALVSVSNKIGLIEFLKPLYEMGTKIVSTGGTSRYLKENGIEVMDISEVTNFPEVMDGRVKTLHPHVHMGLLAREGNVEDEKILSQFQVEKFDLLVCNLYPFAESLKLNLSADAMIEKIDIGGPSMLRSASKNFERLTVVCDPEDYKDVLDIKNNHVEYRKKLAAKVFYHTSQYDSLIAQYLNPSEDNCFNWNGTLVNKLRYGENPQQSAWWYRDLSVDQGFQNYQILQGKELSYNNLLDLDSAWGLSQVLDGKNMVAVKHNNPCGVAYGEDDLQILNHLLSSDPVSIFGGIVATNMTVSGKMAEKLNEIFLECVIAPEYTEDALEIFSRKRNLRLLLASMNNSKNVVRNTRKNIKSVLGGLLVQTDDIYSGNAEHWEFFGKKPTSELLKQMLNGEKICGYLKSNAIALVDSGKTIGLGMGQVNRIDAVQQAIGRAKKFHQITENTVLISDAFFPFKDSIELIAASNIKWVLQPGGSVKDAEVIGRAKELDVELIFSGKRHFRH